MLLEIPEMGKTTQVQAVEQLLVELEEMVQQVLL
mgnify:CR=1 FL=1